MNRREFDFEIRKVNDKVICINEDGKYILFDKFNTYLNECINNSIIASNNTDIVVDSSCTINDKVTSYRFYFENDNEKQVVTLRIKSKNYNQLYVQNKILNDSFDKVQIINKNKRNTKIKVLALTATMIALLPFIKATSSKEETKTYYESSQVAMTSEQKAAKKEYEEIFKEVATELYGETYTEYGVLTEEMENEVLKQIEYNSKQNNYQKTKSNLLK